MITPATTTSRPMALDNAWTLAVYVLYCVGYFTAGVTALVGIIIAYVKLDGADPMLRSHYRFQIRTFWISAFYLTAGVVLSLIGIGLMILAWWFIWSLIRVIKGLLTLSDGKPIARPDSWLFG